MSDLTKEQMKSLKKVLLANSDLHDEDSESQVPAEVRYRYRNVFLNTEDGRYVLAHLLMIMGYNTKISHPQEIGIHNVAQGILDILGVGSHNMLSEAISTWAILPAED